MKTISEPSYYYRSKNGFTLVELLVVISIIAGLVSILLPSLNKARQVAREAVCKAHLHSLGQFYYMYASDNDDSKIPGSYLWYWHYAWVSPADEDLNGNGQIDADDGVVGLGHLVKGGYIDKPNDDNQSNVFICPGALVNRESEDIWGIRYGDGFGSFSNWKETGAANAAVTVTVLYEMRPEVNPFLPFSEIRKQKLSEYSPDQALLSDMLAWRVSETIHDGKINLLKADASTGVYIDSPRSAPSGETFFLYEMFSEDKAGFFAYYYWNAFTRVFDGTGSFFSDD